MCSAHTQTHMSKKIALKIVGKCEKRARWNLKKIYSRLRMQFYSHSQQNIKKSFFFCRADKAEFNIIRSRSCISNTHTQIYLKPYDCCERESCVPRTAKNSLRKGNRPLVRETLGQGEGHSRWVALSLTATAQKAFDCAMNGKLLALHTRMYVLCTLLKWTKK